MTPDALEGCVNPDTARAGRRLPSSASKVDLLDWALDEFYRQAAEGERPEVESYCDRFPSCRSALRKLLGVGQVLNECPQVMPPKRETALWPRVGEQRGDLTLLRLLGCGSFSRVFLAAETSTGGRLVAVKFSLLGEAEARTLGRLSHPHIVPILSAQLEETTGLTRVCMPYLGSATLEDVFDRVRPAPLSPATSEKAGTRPRKVAVLLDVLRACAQPEDPPAVVDPHLRAGSYTDGVIHWTHQIAEALAFLHERRVCHRDLKPSNVLLDPSGRALLLDFNLSTSARETSVPAGGTLRYMAPEQIHAFETKCAEGVDERADLFALGVIAHELLAGGHPFGPIPTSLSEKRLALLLLERMKGGFPPLRRACPDLERPVAAALDRCLAVDPAERPQNAAELVVELRRQFAPARRLRRWLAGRPRTVAATIGLLVVAAALTGYAWSVAPPYSLREYQQGETAYRAGDYDAAERHFDRAVQADPGNPRLRFARGCARLKQSESLSSNNDKLDRAWADLKPADDRIMDVPTLTVNAYIQCRKQNAREAIAKYNLLSASSPSVLVLNNRAYCHLLRKNFRGARDDLEAAARCDPNCQAVFYNRALLAYNERLASSKLLLPSQALDDIDRAIHLGPQTAGLYRDAARLYDRAALDDLRRIPCALEAPIVTALHFRTREQRIARALSYSRQAITNGKPFDRSLPTFELRLLDPIDLPD
jgi:tetratricopeptide (TPR) repeat protein